MKLALGAAVLAAVALAASACGSSHRTSNPPPPSGPTHPTNSPPLSGPTVSSSRLILNGAIRCTATVNTTVPVGQELGISVSFRNVSKRTVDVQPGYGGVWAVVKSPDGTMYDTRVPWESRTGPGTPAISLEPGATQRDRLRYLRVRWEGPLRVTPGCGTSAAPALRVAVTSPGLPASAKAAVQDVVAATGHLLDHCRPVDRGVAVTGRIDAPKHSAPPLRTRCSISLRAEKDFDVAQVLVTTTTPPQHVHLDQLYEQFTSGLQGSNVTAVAWQFVVTKDGATSVNSADIESSKGKGFAPDWEWTSAGHGSRPGGSRCGSTGGGDGGYAGPLVEFVSICR
jgi:hypothetical protein